MDNDLVTKIEASRKLTGEEIASLDPMSLTAYRESLEEQSQHEQEMIELDADILECQQLIAQCQELLSRGSPELADS